MIQLVHDFYQLESRWLLCQNCRLGIPHKAHCWQTTHLVSTLYWFAHIGDLHTTRHMIPIIRSNFSRWSKYAGISFSNIYIMFGQHKLIGGGEGNIIKTWGKGVSPRNIKRDVGVRLPWTDGPKKINWFVWNERRLDQHCCRWNSTCSLKYKCTHIEQQTQFQVKKYKK